MCIDLNNHHSAKLDHHSQRFTIHLSRTLSPIEKALSPFRRKKKDRQEITRKFKGEISPANKSTTKPLSPGQPLASFPTPKDLTAGQKKKKERRKKGEKIERRGWSFRRQIRRGDGKEISCARYDQTEYLGPVKWPAYALIGIKLSRVAFSNSPRRR